MCVCVRGCVAGRGLCIVCECVWLALCVAGCGFWIVCVCMCEGVGMRRLLVVCGCVGLHYRVGVAAALQLHFEI